MIEKIAIEAEVEVTESAYQEIDQHSRLESAIAQSDDDRKQYRDMMRLYASLTWSRMNLRIFKALLFLATPFLIALAYINYARRGDDAGTKNASTESTVKWAGGIKKNFGIGATVTD